jgi:membrane protein required for colicin V production
MGLGLTQFDVIVLVLLAISAAIGFARGAIREVVALLALLMGAAAAIFSLHQSAPIARSFIHPDWLGTAAALIGVFLVTYLLVRLAGGAIARQIQEADLLGALDRSVGLLIGLARGLVVLGALNLMFNAATPKDLQPHWIVGATTWPLAQTMGKLLTAMAPQGLDIAGRLRPAFDRALHGAEHDAIDDRLKSEGYDARQRGEIEDLVEKSR